jgi:hypothetical protein
MRDTSTPLFIKDHSHAKLLNTTPSISETPKLGNIERNNPSFFLHHNSIDKIDMVAKAREWRTHKNVFL